ADPERQPHATRLHARQLGDDDAGEADHRPDGQVDAAGDDDEADADGEDAEHRDLPQQVDGVRVPEEIRVRDPKGEAHHEEGHAHAEFAPHAACSAAVPVMSLAMRSWLSSSRLKNPVMRRWCMTATRSLIPITSSISELTMMMAMPSLARSAMCR